MKLITKKICPVCNNYLHLKNDKDGFVGYYYLYCKGLVADPVNIFSEYYHYYQVINKNFLARFYLCPKNKNTRYNFDINKNSLTIESPPGEVIVAFKYILDENIEYDEFLEEQNNIKSLI